MLLELMLKSKSTFKEVWYCENKKNQYCITRNEDMTWLVEDDITNDVLYDGCETFYDAIEYIDTL